MCSLWRAYLSPAFMVIVEALPSLPNDPADEQSVMISRTNHPNYCKNHSGGETRMSDNAYMTYQNPQYDWIQFRWWGGEYIEIGDVINGEWVAGDVINVWDHAKGEPLIPRSLDALGTRCDEWLEDHADET